MTIVNNTFPMPDGTTATVAAERIGLYLLAEQQHPEHFWILRQPVNDKFGSLPVIDAEGFGWLYQPATDDESDGWQRRVWDLMMADPVTGTRMMSGGGSLGATWDDDVFWHGPMRIATERDFADGLLDWKFRYWPGGYHQGAPIGDYEILTSPDQAKGRTP